MLNLNRLSNLHLCSCNITTCIDGHKSCIIWWTIVHYYLYVYLDQYEIYVYLYL